MYVCVYIYIYAYLYMYRTPRRSAPWKLKPVRDDSRRSQIQRPRA